MKYIILFFVLFSACTSAQAQIDFNYSLEEIKKIYISDDASYKRKVALNILKNVEQSQKDIVDIIEIGMRTNDSNVKEYSLAALYKLFFLQKSLALQNKGNNPVAYDNYPALMELNSRADLSQRIEALIADKNPKVRDVAVITLDFAYGPSLSIKDRILSAFNEETNLTNRRNLVRLLGHEEYINNKEVQNFLLNILDSEKTEASEIAAINLSKASPPVLAAIPKIMNLLESDERYADDDLLEAITSFGHHAESYLPRIEALATGIDERLSHKRVPANFVRHAKFYKKKISSSVSIISMDVKKQKELVGAFTYEMTKMADGAKIFFSTSEKVIYFSGKSWMLKLSIFCIVFFSIFLALQKYRKRG